MVNKKPITVDHKPHSFVFDKETHTGFLMNRIHDDELLIWMLDNKNKVTVLIEHFSEFDMNFLSQLSEKYVVFFLDRSGKGISYDYNLVKTMTGI
jgi:hypothetical protein